jgi:hypothetical protein
MKLKREELDSVPWALYPPEINSRLRPGIKMQSLEKMLSNKQ